MPRKKKTSVAKLVEQDAKAQADEITRIIGSTCSLLDGLLAQAKPDMPKGTDPVIDRMKAYLDRRGAVSEDPQWIARMRSTVTAYAVQRGRLRGEDAFKLD